MYFKFPEQMDQRKRSGIHRSRFIQMTARPGDIQHQKLSNLVAKLAQLRVIQRAQRLAGIDGI